MSHNMGTDSDRVWLVVLGAVLAMATTLAVEALKYLFSNRNKKKDYKIVVRLELKSLISAIDRLVDQYGTDQYFRITTINELREAAQRADRIRDQITLIRSDSKKEEILGAISDVFIFCADTNNLEGVAWAQPTTPASAAPMLPWNADIFRSRRQMLALRSVDIKRKLNDLISYLENR